MPEESVLDRPLYPHERLEVSRKMVALQQKGEINDNILGQRFSALLEMDRDTVKSTHGGVAMRTAGFHRIEDMMTKFNSGQFLGGLSRKTSEVLSSLVDTVNISGQNVLARIDIEPVLYNWFVKKFPVLDRVMKERSNGLNHSWNLSTSFDEADAQFITELGVTPFGQGVYGQATTNIAILATTRGTSYKEQLGVEASGMTYDGGMDAVDLELQRGAWAMAKKAQVAFFQATNAPTHGAGVANDGTTEDGLYIPNAFVGLRVMLSTLANNVLSGFYPSSGGFTPNVLDAGAATSTVPNPVTQAIQSIVQDIVNYGGEPSAIYLSARAAGKINLEVTQLIRFTSADVNGGIVSGAMVRGVDTAAGVLPLIIIPGNSIGTYTAVGGPNNGVLVEDVYVVDETTISFPFLGSAVPTTIEIPMGFDRTLVRRYIMFWMFGLAMKIPVFNGKVRVAV